MLTLYTILWFLNGILATFAFEKLINWLSEEDEIAEAERKWIAHQMGINKQHRWHEY